MQKFIIGEKKYKRREDLLNQEDKTGIPFLILLVILFLIAYIFFQFVYFSK
jgi:hypothetical protein